MEDGNDLRRILDICEGAAHVPIQNAKKLLLLLEDNIPYEHAFERASLDYPWW
jgi:hypothetical protein